MGTTGTARVSRAPQALVLLFAGAGGLRGWKHAAASPLRRAEGCSGAGPPGFPPLRRVLAKRSLPRSRLLAVFNGIVGKRE